MAGGRVMGVELDGAPPRPDVILPSHAPIRTQPDAQPWRQTLYALAAAIPRFAPRQKLPHVRGKDPSRLRRQRLVDLN